MVNLNKSNEDIETSPIEMNDGSFRFTVSESDGESIDNCELAVLKTAFPAIRSAISKHLEAVSKKKL